MSVDVNMNIGFGFVVPRDKYIEMKEYALERDTWCKVEDEFYCINCYTDRTDYFLGETFFGSEETIPISIANIVPEDFDAIAFAEKYEEILDICGVDIMEDWAVPKFWAFLSYS